MILTYSIAYIKELDKLCKWFQVNTLSVNTSTTNFTVFTNKSCDDTYSVCMNEFIESVRHQITKCAYGP